MAIPRTLYAAEVWCSLPRREANVFKAMAVATKSLVTIQRAGALAITGGLCTLLMDTLDASVFLLPVPLNIDKRCHNAMICLAMLLKEHPLHRAIASGIVKSLVT